MFAQRHIVDIDDIQKLGELCIHLSNRGVGTFDDQRYT